MLLAYYALAILGLVLSLIIGGLSYKHYRTTGRTTGVVFEALSGGLGVAVFVLGLLLPRLL